MSGKNPCKKQQNQNPSHEIGTDDIRKNFSNSWLAAWKEYF